jgi:hypothetical protein
MKDKDSDFVFEVETSKGTLQVRLRWWAFWGPILVLVALVIGKCTGVV